MKGMLRFTKILAIIGIAGYPCIAAAEVSFFEQRYRGWLWFDERQGLEEEVESEIPSRTQPQMPSLEEMERAKSENEKFAKELELLKHLAVRYPDNLEYIKLYKLKEKEMMDKAETLGLNWLTVNFLNPDIVDELNHPQNIYGRNILSSNKERENKQIIKNLSGKVELFVFRREECPYCETLEKHLNIFAVKYGFKVEAVVPDNSVSKYFKTHRSLELIKVLSLEVMPTVIAVVNDSRERFELVRGAVSVADLEEKSLLLAKYLNIELQEPRKEQIQDRVNTKRTEFQDNSKRECGSCVD